MIFWTLKPDGAIIARQSAYNLTPEEERNPAIEKLLKDFDKSVEERIGNNVAQADIKKISESNDGELDTSVSTPPDELFATWDSESGQEPAFNEVINPIDVDDYTPEATDDYLQTELLVPRNGDMVMAKVVRRVKDSEGRPTGKRHDNPILDTRQYEVEFNDGTLDT